MKKRMRCAIISLCLSLAACGTYTEPLDSELAESSEVSEAAYKPIITVISSDTETDDNTPPDETDNAEVGEPENYEAAEPDNNEAAETEAAGPGNDEGAEIAEPEAIELVDAGFPDEITSPWAVDYGDGEYNKKYSWYYSKNEEHQPPGAQREFDIRQYGGYYLGDIENREIYLTFDEGYENGYTAQILDVLKDKNVKASFFLTRPYITKNPDLVRRMVDEGHVTASHTANHPSMPDCSDAELDLELISVEEAFREVTGLELDKFLRPPMGEYSPRTLEHSMGLGYKTVFWSFAYQDWLVDNQPSPEYAYEQVMKYLHNGAILLLHAVSSANANALGDIIDGVRERGFEFKTLHDLPGSQPTIQ